MKAHTEIPQRSGASSKGFTLLEMVVVMFVLMLLLGAIVTIIRGTVQLTDEMMIEQTREARLHAFAQLCERTFRGLPAHGMVRLRNKQAGNRYLYQLAMLDAPSPLLATGRAGEVTVFETEEAPDGYLRVYLRSLTVDQALAWEQGEPHAGTRLLLLENVASLDWRFYNEQSREWEPLWNESFLLPLNAGVLDGQATPPPAGDDQEDQSARRELMGNAAAQLRAMQRGMRPGMIELTLAQGAGAAQRWVFWVPRLNSR